MHRANINGSTSSLWGSAGAHFTEFGDRRFLLDTTSVPETKVSLHIDNHNDMLTGSRNVVCSTEAESKANKLNRSEQAKLESLQTRMTKEKEVFQRRFRQNEKVFRAKSAKLINRSRTLEPSVTTRPSSLYSNWKPQSVPTRSEKSYITNNNNNSQQQCDLCSRIQQVVRSYELDGQQKNMFDHVTHDNHSECLLSDAQARAFLEVLESEFFNETPSLHSKLRDSGLFSHMQRKGTYLKRSREEIDHKETAKNIEARIRQFCIDMDRYNKENVSIPKEVKDALERVRLSDAIAKSERPELQREPSCRSRMRQEVREKLDVNL